MRKKFETEFVDKALREYKESPTGENLELLYNSLDHVVTTITKHVASSFSKKHPDDFLDIQQNVRIKIFKILKRLAEISETGNQVISIVVKASVWAFRIAYRKYKKTTPVKGQGPSSEWSPEYEVPVEIPIDVLVHPSTKVAKDPNLTVSKEYTWINSCQYEAYVLTSLPELVIDTAVSFSRFSGKEKDEIIRFCLTAVMEGRSPSIRFIAKRWNEPNPKFWVKYSKILFRLAMLSVIRGNYEVYNPYS